MKHYISKKPVKAYLIEKPGSKGRPRFYIRIIWDNHDQNEPVFRDQDGKPIRDPVKAEADYQRILAAIERGEDPFITDIDLEEWAARYFDFCIGRKAPKTIENERKHCGVLFALLKREYPRARTPRDITPHMLKQLQTIRLRSPKRVPVKGGGHKSAAQPISARTVNLDRAFWKSFFRFVIENGGLTKDPSEALPPVREVRRGKNALTVEQVLTILETLQGTRQIKDGRLIANFQNGTTYALAFQLLLETGIRPAELAFLRWQDVDLEGRTIWVVSHAAHTTKTKNDRPIPLSLGIARLLTTYKEQTVKPEASDWLVFSTGSGRNIQNALKLAVKRACAKAGIPEINLYQLRHTAITNMLDAGGRIHDVASVAGHSSITTTQLYMHAGEMGRRRAADGASLESLRERSRKVIPINRKCVFRLNRPRVSV